MSALDDYGIGSTAQSLSGSPQAHIAALVSGISHRDQGRLNEFAALFHPQAMIYLSWFEGSIEEFVTATEQMIGSDLRTKHFTSPPVITIAGPRAIAETDVILTAENRSLQLGANAHVRFYHRIENRQGKWGFTEKRVFYDMSQFTFPMGVIDINRLKLSKYPPEYAALAYLMEDSGFHFKKDIIVGRSEDENLVKRDGEAWLEGSRLPLTTTTTKIGGEGLLEPHAI